MVIGSPVNVVSARIDVTSNGRPSVLLTRASKNAAESGLDFWW